jgi:hypothetical protein
MSERGGGIERAPTVGDHRQRVIVDRDQRCGVLGNVTVVGDDQRDRLADIANLVRCQRRLRTGLDKKWVR